MGLRLGEMCLLKPVMRDITNPQYWAKLSLNPLMIAVFSLVHRTGLHKPLWCRGGPRGREGAGPFLEAEAWDCSPHLCSFSEVAVPVRRRLAWPGGWVHAGPADAHPVVRWAALGWLPSYGLHLAPELFVGGGLGVEDVRWEAGGSQPGSWPGASGCDLDLSWHPFPSGDRP